MIQSMTGYGKAVVEYGEKKMCIRDRYNYAKLLRLMFLGYIAFAVVCYLDPHGYHGYTVGRVVAQLFMYINILPDPDHRCV